MVGKQLSHRIVGPVYAFEKWVDNYVDGNYYTLRLRKGDEFHELEDLAERISTDLRPVNEVSLVPILPEGQPEIQKQSQELSS